MLLAAIVVIVIKCIKNLLCVHSKIVQCSFTVYRTYISYKATTVSTPVLP